VIRDIASNLTFRQALPADAEALRRACWPDWPQHVADELLERASARSTQGRGYAVVACEHGVVRGYGQVTIWGDSGEIADLIVDARHRGRGIGTAIIRHLTGSVRKWGLSVVEIGVAASNPRALALYQRLGFRADRTLLISLGNGPEPVIYLRKTVDEE
jgi:ribosomal protein S18 acetylase RimI-like enzyme